MHISGEGWRKSMDSICQHPCSKKVTINEHFGSYSKFPSILHDTGIITLKKSI